MPPVATPQPTRHEGRAADDLQHVAGRGLIRQTPGGRPVRCLNSPSNLAFSIAMTAWSAKFSNKAICRSVNGSSRWRTRPIFPITFPSRSSGTRVRCLSRGMCSPDSLARRPRHQCAQRGPHHIWSRTKPPRRHPVPRPITGLRQLFTPPASGASRKPRSDAAAARCVPSHPWSCS
jgi:hypothetical protein